MESLKADLNTITVCCCQNSIRAVLSAVSKNFQLAPDSGPHLKQSVFHFEDLNSY